MYLNENLTNVKKSVSDGKSLIASAITEKGVETASDATFETMASNIGNIEVSTLPSSATFSYRTPTISGSGGLSISSSGFNCSIPTLGYSKADVTLINSAGSNILISSNVGTGTNINVSSKSSIAMTIQSGSVAQNQAYYIGFTIKLHN